MRSAQKLFRDIRLYLILSIKGLVNNCKLFYRVVSKHSTPISIEIFYKSESLSDRVTLIGVFVNIFMFFCKFVGGTRFGSAVLIADAFHSLSDMIADFITLWAVQIARLPPDDDHPYGHGKFEAVGSLFLSIILLLTGTSIATWSYENMLEVMSLQHQGSSHEAVGEDTINNPTWPAVILAAISIGCKEWLYQITNQVGVQLNSQVIIANAWHHRSDACSSILSTASIIIAIIFPKLLFIDSAAGIVVAGMICLTGFEIMCESMKQLTDSVDQDLVSDIQATVLNISGILDVNHVRARSCGSVSLVDLTIVLESSFTIEAVQVVVVEVRESLLLKFPHVTDVLIQTAMSNQREPGTGVDSILSVAHQHQYSPTTDVESEIHDLLVRDADVTGIVKVAVTQHPHQQGSSTVLSVEAVISLDTSRYSVDKAKSVVERIKEDIKRVSESIGTVIVYIDLIGRSGCLSP